VDEKSQIQGLVRTKPITYSSSVLYVADGDHPLEPSTAEMAKLLWHYAGAGIAVESSSAPQVRAAAGIVCLTFLDGAFTPSRH